MSPQAKPELAHNIDPRYIPYASNMLATKFFHWSYVKILKPVLFRFDPENMHDFFCSVGLFLGRYGFTRRLTSIFFEYRHPMLEQTVLGMKFSNPIGLAAGFDKNASLTGIMPDVGFGFEEVGSITGESCDGNPKPRLWRLPKSKSLLVYYGLKNDGCESIAARLKNLKFRFPIGTSIAKTNSQSTVDMQAGIADYVKSFKAFVSIGDYFTINVSCPNAYGGEPYSSPERLDLLLSATDQIETKKPIFLKISADTPPEDLERLVEVTDRHRVQGFIISNLAKNRDNHLLDRDEIRGLDNGGISGKPVENLANELISRVYQMTRGRYVIMGCGGVFTAEDAYKKIRNGASLVQLITGMIYEGPQMIGQINRGLAELLKRDGFKNISEAVGIDRKANL
ncbi:MAG: quinone-dependent dihydroorotate dehydrogenase [Patescibacteria group bacterium]